ncbi:MAG: alpha/beta hydrolase [Hyphomicrobiales bacterium]|nr:alpha/beta hydrolase [Hyphomicrobiales bacterium]
MSSQVRAIAVVAGAAVWLAACSGPPKGVLGAYHGKLAVTPNVKMLVATTRSRRGATPGELFGGERARRLNFADIHISIPPDSRRKVGEVQWPSSLPGDPRTNFVTTYAQVFDQKAALKVFHERLKGTAHGSVLLFVHGYNTRFEEAVYRFAQIVHDSGTKAVPALFTWPSRGQLLAYTYDRESANYSRDALEAVLQAMAKDPAVKEISILAHSMGNWVTMEALRQMAIRDKRIAPKIKNVMMAAPDVDIDVFGRQIAEIGQKRPPFTLFVSQDDKALAVSRRVWGSEARVGQVDPRKEPYRSMFERQRIAVIDLTDKASSDSVNHAKFATSPQVVRMIGQRLAQGQVLTDAKSGLGERVGLLTTGAARTIGSAAGLAVSVPLAIVDRRTRESIGSQVGAVGGGLKDTIGSAGNVVTGR